MYESEMLLNLRLQFFSLHVLFQVRFYASEIILGLEHMHDRKICYRDLKVTGAEKCI